MKKTLLIIALFIGLTNVNAQSKNSQLMMSFISSETNNNSKEINSYGKTYIPYFFHKGETNGCTYGAGLIMVLDCDDVYGSNDAMDKAALSFMNSEHPSPAGNGRYKYIQMNPGLAFDSKDACLRWIEKKSSSLDNKLSCYKGLGSWTKSFGERFCD